MSYSCLEELQVDLDLYYLDKTSVLSKVGCKYEDGWFVIIDDGICYLFDKDGNLDDIKKVTQLKEKHIKKDIKKIIIPNSVTSIVNFTFACCSDLTSVTIGNSVTSIGNNAFSNCTSLMSVTIPNSVTNIGRSAFMSCSSLTNVAIPDSVTSIGSDAFYGCSSLTNVTIGNGVTSIEPYVFFKCNNLKSLVFKGKTFEEVQCIQKHKLDKLISSSLLS